MTAAAPENDKSIRLWNLSPSFSFLPPDGNFIIVCSDSKHDLFSSASSERTFNAFAINKDDLAKKSPFFDEMFQLSNNVVCKGSDDGSKESARIEVPEGCFAVGHVLSAAMEPSRTHLASCKDWEPLIEALHLAIKWKLEDARMGIFLAMQERLLRTMTTYTKKSIRMGIVDFLVEAVRQGDSAFVMATSILRTKASADGFTYQTHLLMPEMSFSEVHFLEVGAMGCSKVARALVRMIQEGLHTCEI